MVAARAPSPTRGPTIAAVLADGRYDAVVIDAEETGDGAISLDLVLASGEHKGHVVTVVARGMSADPLELLAVPATIHVTDGNPTVELEP